MTMIDRDSGCGIVRESRANRTSAGDLFIGGNYKGKLLPFNQHAKSDQSQFGVAGGGGDTNWAREPIFDSQKCNYDAGSAFPGFEKNDGYALFFRRTSRGPSCSG